MKVKTLNLKEEFTIIPTTTSVAQSNESTATQMRRCKFSQSYLLARVIGLCEVPTEGKMNSMMGSDRLTLHLTAFSYNIV